MFPRRNGRGLGSLWLKILAGWLLAGGSTMEGSSGAAAGEDSEGWGQHVPVC